MSDVIKSQENIDLIRKMFIKHSTPVYVQIWNFGINVGLTIRDAISIPMPDALQACKSGKLSIMDKKKRINVYSVNDAAKKIIQLRHKEYQNDKWLFQSHSRNSNNLLKHLSYTIVAKNFSNIGDILGLKIGAHSMRKTRAYMLYKNGVSIDELKTILLHHTRTDTCKYLEISLTPETDYKDIIL